MPVSISSMPQPHAHTGAVAALSRRDVHCQLIAQGVRESDADLLLQEEIDGLALLTLTDAALTAIGVATFGRRSQILTAARTLADSHAGTGTSKTVADRADSSDDDAEYRLSYDDDSVCVHSHPISNTSRNKMLAARHAQQERAKQLAKEKLEQQKREAKEKRLVTERQWAEREETERRELEELAVLQAKIEKRRQQRAEENKRMKEEVKQVEDEEAELAKLRLARAEAREKRHQRRQRSTSTDSDTDSDSGGDSRHDSLDRTNPAAEGEPSASVKSKQSIVPALVPALPADFTPPRQSLQLEWVYGYSTVTPNNLAFNQSSDIVFPCSLIGVVMRKVDGKGWRQLHYTGHTATIGPLTQHPRNRNLIATGQCADPQTGKPLICVWDSANTIKSIRLSLDANDVTVKSLSFSHDGEFLASISGDGHHTLKLWQWEQSKLCAAVHTDTNTIHGVHFNQTKSLSHELVTVGVQHIAFWYWSNGLIRGKRAVLPASDESSSGSVSYHSCTFSIKGFACIGSSYGTVLVYSDAEVPPRVYQIHDRDVKITSLVAYEGGLVSGGSDGCVITMNRKMEILRKIELPCKILSVSIDDGRDLLIGGRSGCVWRVSRDGVMSLAMSGHFDGQLLCVDVVTTVTNTRAFVTAGEDNLVHLWDLAKHALIHTINLDPSASIRHNVDSTSASALSISVCAKHSLIVIGTKNGQLRFYDTQMKFLYAHCDSHHGSGDSSGGRGVSAQSFAPNGAALAVGMQNGSTVICQLTVTDNHTHTASATDREGQSRIHCEVRCVIESHSDAIATIDWSIDGKWLLVTDASYQSQYYRFHSSSYSLSLVDGGDLLAVHHTPYSSNTTPLSWHTHALYNPRQQSLSGISQTAHITPASTNNHTNPRSTEGLLVSAHDGFLHLYRFTGLAARGLQSRQTRAHAGSVSSMRFANDGKSLLTIGKNDRAIMQWKVING